MKHASGNMCTLCTFCTRCVRFVHVVYVLYTLTLCMCCAHCVRFAPIVYVSMPIWTLLPFLCNLLSLRSLKCPVTTWKAGHASNGSASSRYSPDMCNVHAQVLPFLDAHIYIYDSGVSAIIKTFRRQGAQPGQTPVEYQNGRTYHHPYLASVGLQIGGIRMKLHR